MLNSETFSEILSEVLNAHNQHNQPSSNYNSGWESTLDPFGLSQILVQTPTYTINVKYAKSRYAHLNTKVHTPKAPHLFNAEQALAFASLHSLSPELTPSFNQKQLKSAYRKAVLKTHPDRGGTSESFQDVKKNYLILEALVKNEA